MFLAAKGSELMSQKREELRFLIIKINPSNFTVTFAFYGLKS